MCTFTTVCKTINFFIRLKINAQTYSFSERRKEKGETRAAYWFCIRATSEKKGKNIIVETNVAPPPPPFRKHKGFKYMKPAQLCSYPLKGHQLPKLGCVAERNKNETGSNQLWNQYGRGGRVYFKRGRIFVLAFPPPPSLSGNRHGPKRQQKRISLINLFQLSFQWC